ncbi:alpha-L-rhamnosidase [Cohnella sp. REN36]|uniref:alpha-L-rhamnosidase n=1 Tax=Cohnella sp. REN36 TaxID=2887347 RepID=UPI001D13718A|nr:alpha-L-rhamnosidase [Cohnella sp. REN36]MCC3371551.1 glycoside hydrolase family 78 protein [Cohnella sp. REN36]
MTAAGFAGHAGGMPPIAVRSLRVNGLASPLGLDDQHIRFSWQMESPIRGYVPAAARVWVATEESRLGIGHADVWDSGPIAGDTQQADYGGPPLAGGARYWWRVAVYDVEGREAVSQAAFWDTGLRAEDWRARWIWKPGRIRQNDFAYLRKEIEIGPEVAYAKLFVSAHHVAQVYLDGVRIGGYGSPAPTHPWKRKYYLAYDVTERLQPGVHAIAAIAHYLGGSGQNYVDGVPGFRLQLEIVYADGERTSFGTDATWESLSSIPHRCGTSYQQNRRISAIEDYDARERDPAWLEAGFRAPGRRRAVAAPAETDAWPMRWQTIPEGAIEEEIVPIAVSSREEARVAGPGEPPGRAASWQVFDAGKIVSGWPRISLPGVRDVTIRLRYAEELNELGRVKHQVCNERSAHYYDQYTMRGDANETWAPDLSYKAFRYIEVTGYPAAIVPGEQLRIVSAHTDAPLQGRLATSSRLLNDMALACYQTQKNNMLGQLVDCPHREQAQYLADSDLQAESLLYNFDARHLLEKVLADFADAQREDGTFPFVFPSNPDHPEFSLQIPEWDLHFCTLLWKHYEFYGDERVLVRYYEPARRMVDYFLGIASAETGLVPLDKGWHISDWPYPTVDHESEFLTTQQIKLYGAARIVAELAGIGGRIADSVHYRTRAETLKRSIVAHLYDEERRRFRDGYGSSRHHQGVNALALHTGLVPADDRDAAIDFVAGTPWEAKTVLSLPLLRALFKGGRQEAAYRILSREEYPGWGYMIRQGATTMWEGWDDIESHCHAWNGYPVRLLQEYIVGIRPASPGFASATIEPYLPPDLSFAEAAVPTVRGEVAVRWERKKEGRGVRLALRLPTGMRAVLVLGPSTGGAPEWLRLLEGARTIWSEEGYAAGVPGIVRALPGPRGLAVELLSGDYAFDIFVHPDAEKESKEA